MDNIALEQLVPEVDACCPMSVTVAPDEGSKVVHARRVTENDWRLTVAGTDSLAGRLESVVDAAPEGAQGTCETVGRRGRDHVRLKIGCRGPHLLTNVLQVVIDDHAAAHPLAHLQAMLQVDDFMRPRRIDLLFTQKESTQGGMVSALLGQAPVQSV